jgi:hypothetical protein
MPSTLSSADKATYDSIFSHPVSHNLERKELISVLGHLSEQEEEQNGKLKFSRNGQTLTLGLHGKDVDVEEIMHVRHFLKSSKLLHESAASLCDVAVVLDHSGARIYLIDDENSTPVHVKPLDPSGHDQQVHNPQGDSGGKQGPHRRLFYEALANHLEEAGRILLIGDGHGASSEREKFLKELDENHHTDLASRIVGSETVNLSHMTDAQLIATGRTFFTSLGS